MLAEICCGSYDDAVKAQKGGASRIELNSALYLGGLTPSIATLLNVKNNLNLETICMVRPRGGGFCYNDNEIETMFLDAEILLDNGANGIAFGFLNEDNEIDIIHTKKMVELIHSYNATAVFHRAIDCVEDIERTMDILITMRVDRILTSGMQQNAIEGKEMIKYLQQHYGDYIEILPGSGINEDNVSSFIEYTGVHQVHSSCKCWKKDPTTMGAKGSFSYHDDEYEAVDENKVKRLMEAID